MPLYQAPGCGEYDASTSIARSAIDSLVTGSPSTRAFTSLWQTIYSVYVGPRLNQPIIKIVPSSEVCIRWLTVEIDCLDMFHWLLLTRGSFKTLAGTSSLTFNNSHFNGVVPRCQMVYIILALLFLLYLVSLSPSAHSIILLGTPRSLLHLPMMDDKIWKELPEDLLYQLINFSDHSTLRAWSLTNSDLSRFALKLLWQCITISASSDMKRDKAYHHFPYTPLFEGSGRVNNFLLGSPFQISAKRQEISHSIPCPRTLVQYLTFTLPYRFDKHVQPQKIVMDSASLVARLPNLKGIGLRCYRHVMPLLRSVEYFPKIISLRLDSDGECSCSNSVDRPHENTRSLNWVKELRHLTSVSVLRVNWLCAYDAEMMADVISHLPLLKLTIKFNAYQLIRPRSALVHFIERCACPPFNDSTTEIKGGFPHTLEVLHLHGPWHSTCETPWADLNAAIQPCQQLRSLYLEIYLGGPIVPCFSQLYLPNLESLYVSTWSVYDEESQYHLPFVIADRDIPDVVPLDDVPSLVGISESDISAAEHFCDFLWRHQKSLQHFEVADVMDRYSNLVKLIQCRLDWYSLENHNELIFAAEELRMRESSLPSNSLASRIFGRVLSQKNDRWGTALQRIRIEAVEWVSFIIDDIRVPGLENLKVLDLRNERKSIPSSCIAQMALDILKMGPPTLRIIKIASRRFWVERTISGRILWDLDAAQKDKLQGAEVERTITILDKRFLAEKSLGSYDMMDGWLYRSRGPKDLGKRGEDLKRTEITIDKDSAVFLKPDLSENSWSKECQKFMEGWVPGTETFSHQKDVKPRARKPESSK